ncbi:MAG: hypothetical protein OEZ65_06215 [Gemmatimonadota bacterium]|nr:hypothetical protein [Gemmatimonadota bacterium]MDH5759165.1 hypothetical protein [Gemmatimonadota bacterium]
MTTTGTITTRPDVIRVRKRHAAPFIPFLTDFREILFPLRPIEWTDTRIVEKDSGSDDSSSVCPGGPGSSTASSGRALAKVRPGTINTDGRLVSDLVLAFQASLGCDYPPVTDWHVSQLRDERIDPTRLLNLIPLLWVLQENKRSEFQAAILAFGMDQRVAPDVRVAVLRSYLYEEDPQEHRRNFFRVRRSGAMPGQFRQSGTHVLIRDIDDRCLSAVATEIRRDPSLLLSSISWLVARAIRRGSIDPSRSGVRAFRRMVESIADSGGDDDYMRHVNALLALTQTP